MADEPKVVPQTAVEPSTKTTIVLADLLTDICNHFVYTQSYPCDGAFLRDRSARHLQRLRLFGLEGSAGLEATLEKIHKEGQKHG